jgi:hypothetical protein
VALAYHVDYWDDLGWRDRFALSAAVTRQRRYAVSLSRSSVYTPQVIIDGRNDYSGGDRAAIGRALEDARSGVAVRIAVSAGELQVSIDAGDRAAAGDVVLVAYRREAVVAVGRGENGGRTLHEFNIVRAIRPLGRWDGSARSFRLPRASLPRDATDVAALVEPSGGTGIIGAATQALE